MLSWGGGRRREAAGARLEGEAAPRRPKATNRLGVVLGLRDTPALRVASGSWMMPWVGGKQGASASVAEMTADDYYKLLHAGVAPRLVEMARDFASLAETDLKAAERKLEDADVIFAVWRTEGDAFGFVPVFGGERLRNSERRLRLAALFAPSETEALMLAHSHQLATQ